MSQSRQLAAIMFTDIVGYTALMGRDSTKATPENAYRLFIEIGRAGFGTRLDVCLSRRG